MEEIKSTGVSASPTGKISLGWKSALLSLSNIFVAALFFVVSAYRYSFASRLMDYIQPLAFIVLGLVYLIVGVKAIILGTKSIRLEKGKEKISGIIGSVVGSVEVLIFVGLLYFMWAFSQVSM